MKSEKEKEKERSKIENESDFDCVMNEMNAMCGMVRLRKLGKLKIREKTKCSYCNVICASKKDLQLHQESHEKNNRLHQCQACHKRFFKKCHLCNHYKLKHISNKK